MITRGACVVSDEMRGDGVVVGRAFDEDQFDPNDTVWMVAEKPRTWWQRLLGYGAWHAIPQSRLQEVASD